ncbi:MAG: tRNA (adenosine(37)-N6)-threonylcarbamoyltransferase complex ATPase subunit type 1 TsaE [Endozoicomonadaceae bacterium]|nr:tRNA (adenosine(37)-N6)-threonylcarbamoyltransferase complex ATPase subunit type 1 TsaE [Endozoicomonadaceae bacterium]
MKKFGNTFALASKGQGIIYLEGALGTGKTTLSRSILRALGVSGTIRSPTYTLVETYVLPPQPNEIQDIALRYIYHLDLYRIQDPYELYDMGLRDYLDETLSMMLIEWPNIGKKMLPEPDLIITIHMIKKTRLLSCQSHSAYGEKIIYQLT